jgi:ERCC4-type nuclease
MTLFLNKQEFETLKEYLPPDTVVDSEIGTDIIIQGVEKNRMYERKELKDFLASVHDGRIFEQLKDLSNNKDAYEPFIILEGLGFYDWSVKKWLSLSDYFSHHPERKMAFYEVLTAFRAFGVGLVITTDKYDTALFLTHQNVKLGKPKVKKEYPERRGFKRDWDNEKKKLYFMEAFGHETGKALLREFKRVDVIPRDVEMLAEIRLGSGRRIGKTKAEEIYDVIHT